VLQVLEFHGEERWAITAFMYRRQAAPHTVATTVPLTPPLPPSSLAPRILVSIASYRDDECPRTVDDLFRTAAEPHRVRVAVRGSAPPVMCRGAVQSALPVCSPRGASCRTH
jgi:hypothetical protein